MSYLGRMIHSCVIKRSTPGFSPLYQPMLGEPVQVGESVCLLLDTSEAAISELFGETMTGASMVYFPPGVDVRPRKDSTDSQGDLLVITKGEAVETWWAAAVKDIQGRGFAVAARRWSS